MHDEENVQDGSEGQSSADEGTEEVEVEVSVTIEEAPTSESAESAESTETVDVTESGSQVVRRLTIGRVAGDLRIKGRSSLGFEIEAADGSEGEPTVSWNGSDVTVDSPVGCTIRIPGSATLDVGEVEGALRIKGVAGDVVIGEVGRDVALKNVGATTIETVGERLNVKGMAGDLSASTIGGSADVRSVAGAASIETVGGSLDVSDVQGDVDASVGGSARVDDSHGEGAAIRIMAGGSIECLVPEDLAADIRATAGGAVRIDLPEVDVHGQVQNYTGSVGGGGTPIELTAGGSIRVVGAVDGPPRVAFEPSAASAGSGAQASGHDHDHDHDHAHDHAHDFKKKVRARARVHADAAHEAWEGGEWSAKVSDLEKDVSKLVREAAGRLDGLGVEINAQVAEALASLPGALESAGLSEEHATRLAMRLQRIGERATERAERQIKRAMSRAEREVGSAGKRAGEAGARQARVIRKKMKMHARPGRQPRAVRDVRVDEPPAATGDEVRSVLRMLESGSITAGEAERILSALEPRG